MSVHMGLLKALARRARMGFKKTGTQEGESLGTVPAPPPPKDSDEEKERKK